MRGKKVIGKEVQFQNQSKHQRFAQSILVCEFIVSELLKKVETELPPHLDHLMTYSGLAMKKTTQKIVNLNLLDSFYIDNSFDSKNQQESFYESNNESQNFEHKINRTTANSNSKFCSPKTTLFTNESKTNASKLVQDEEIIIKKQGLKFVKMQDVKNLIKSKTSDMFSSAHCSYSPTYSKIHTQHSLYQLDYQKPERKSLHSNGRSTHKPIYKTTIISNNLMVPTRQLAKSFKTFSTLQQLNNNNNENKTVNEKKQIEMNRQRISAMVNCGQFVNINDYYQQKNKQLKKKKNIPFCRQFEKRQNNDNSVQMLSGTHKTYNNTLVSRESQSIDEDDIVINRLRERKERFYRSGNNFEEDLLKNKNRQGTILINQTQKNSQKDQFGAFIAFDYNGQAIPTIKYDMLKIPQHYQDMDFSIVEQDESIMKKKKQRKDYVFSGGVNLKLVDHKKFLPHPNDNFNPLAGKKETQMKEIFGYMLKKGVEVRPKQDSFSWTATNNEQEQSKQRINKRNFEFLHNEEIQPQHVRFKQFLKYKKGSLSSNKNITSKKKIEESSNCGQSMPSKKSFSIKMHNSKSTLQDNTNKVHKSQNPKNLQMLMGNNQDERSPFGIVHYQKSQQAPDNNFPTGVLKKSSINRLNKSGFNDSINFQKKKVRIA